jgi:thioesterase domain-containing protein
MIAVSLTSRVRDAFGVEVPMRRVLEGPTVAALALLIEEASPRAAAAARPRASHPTTLVEIQGGDRTRTPFFTVHAAGGNVLSYYALATYLGRERAVYALQAPGLEGEEGEIFTRLEDLAASHVRAVRSAQPHGPYLLGGWSAGGTVAFEMAQQLRRVGEEVLLVALMDTYAPKTGDDLDEMRMLLWQAYRFKLSMGLEELARFTTYAEQLDYVLMRARAAGLIPEEVDQEQAHRLLDTELRILRAMLNYRPAVLDARLAYFRCLEGTDFGDFAELFPGINEIDHADAWRDYTMEPMTIHDIPGHHQAMMEEPGVRSLAERLREAIAEVETAAAAGTWSAP